MNPGSARTESEEKAILVSESGGNQSLSGLGPLKVTISLLNSLTKQIDWDANPNIRPVCLPHASAGDYDQSLATTTGPSSDGGDDSSFHGLGVSDNYDFEGGGL